jgi:hypothetical protein
MSIIVLDDKCTLMQSKCAMCRFLGTSMIKSAEQYNPTLLWLEPAGPHSCAHLYASDIRTRKLHHEEPWLDVGLIPHRMDGYSQTVRPNLVSPFVIDFELLRLWIRRCQENHGRCDSQSEPDELDGFRLIDCTTRNVVQASVSWQYVALSYVWGSGSFDPHAKWPLVIEDSIAVVLSLKHRYLWVDRYVRQDAPDHTMADL